MSGIEEQREPGAEGAFTPVSEETERQSAEFEMLRRMLAVSRDTFSLSLAVCNSPALRDHLIGRLSAADGSVRVVDIPDGTVDVFGYVREQVAEVPASALCIVDLETSLPSAAQSFPTLRSLNASRELWKERFAIPVIFWLPEYAAVLLLAHARDFWRWFSHQFEFVSERADLAAALSERYAGNTGVAAQLDADQKRFRIAELEQRLGQAGPELEPQMLRYVLLWLGELAFLYQFVGELDQAEAMLRKALEIYEKLGRREGLAAAYGNLGLICLTRGDLEQAEAMLRKALEIAEELGRPEGTATAYGSLGLICLTRGDLEQAEAMLRKSLEIEETLGRREGMADAYGNLGLIYQNRGDLDQAEAMHRKALAIDEKLGRREGMAIRYGNLGVIYQTRGDLEQAEAMHRKALAIDEQLGRREGMANHYANLGAVYEQRGDLVKARELRIKARDLYRQIGMPHMVAKVQGWIDELG